MTEYIWPSSLKNFRLFLLENKVFVTIVGVLLGHQLKSLTNVIVKDLITPLFNMDLNQDGVADGNNLFELVLKARGMEFRVGNVLKALITFFIMVCVAFILSKWTKDFVSVKN